MKQLRGLYAQTFFTFRTTLVIYKFAFLKEAIPSIYVVRWRNSVMPAHSPPTRKMQSQKPNECCMRLFPNH